MKAIALLWLMAMLWGCTRYPSKLPPEEQIQALVFEDLGAKLFDRTSLGDDAYRLFLCYGDPQGDPSPAVLAYVQRSFKSARPCSAAAPSESGPVTERVTGRTGCELRIAPFKTEGEETLVLNVVTHCGPNHGEGYEYRVQREKRRWKILKRERLWVS